ncbi:MAG: cysteine desulfurase family protein [Bacteroidota bacterium]
MSLNLPVYLDNNSTTKPDPRVVDAMVPYLTERYGNAASEHEFGWVARAAVDNAREKLATLLGAGKDEIIFTSGATESINLALKGVAEAYASRGRHVITAATEHRAVLDTCKVLERHGFSVTILPVDARGLVSPSELERAMSRDTIIVSIMAANNEIGTIAPLEEIGALCRSKEVLLHSDATQAIGRVPFDLSRIPVDLVSFSAHKMHGPKGVGALYVRSSGPRIRLVQQIDGGGHERGLRSGTANVPAIVGFGEAAGIAVLEMEPGMERISSLRDRLVAGIMSQLEDARLNGHPEHRLPDNANLTFPGAKADRVILDMKEIALSTGSACSSASPEPSHVLKAIGLSRAETLSSLRFGLSRYTTAEEIEYTIGRLVEVIERQRARTERQKTSTSEML